MICSIQSIILLWLSESSFCKPERRNHLRVFDEMIDMVNHSGQRTLEEDEWARGKDVR
jgi:hypothetical protein